jgi:hypothetical protein
MSQRREIDEEKLKEYAKLVFGALGGAMTSSMIYLGDRLGLYTALAEASAATSEEAGFTRFEQIDLRHPVNAFYAVRP